jgi:putative transcriptional regulator
MSGVLALSAFLLAATAQAVPAPAPGVFLVAKPSIDRGPFWHSVVLLLRHGNDGTLGLIVNRTTEIPLAEALPGLSTQEAEGHDLYFGGPVALDSLLYLFRSAEPRKTASEVMDNVHFSGDKELLDRLLDEKVKRNELHLYLGHAGWTAGQLVNELARGDWDMVRADAFTIFQADPEKLWDELTSENTAFVASAYSPFVQR